MSKLAEKACEKKVLRPYNQNQMMITKLIVYGYTDKIFSCHRISKAAHENMTYIWLSGRNTIDFMSINRLWSERMKDVIFQVFA